MMPDFSATAFDPARLVQVRFFAPVDRVARGGFQSDYRCQLRFVEQESAVPDFDVRLYFVGRETAAAGDDVSGGLAFLAGESARSYVSSGRTFELREGSVARAEGEIHVVAARAKSH